MTLRISTRRLLQKHQSSSASGSKVSSPVQVSSPIRIIPPAPSTKLKLKINLKLTESLHDELYHHDGEESPLILSGVEEQQEPANNNINRKRNRHVNKVKGLGLRLDEHQPFDEAQGRRLSRRSATTRILSKPLDEDEVYDQDDHEEDIHEESYVRRKRKRILLLSVGGGDKKEKELIPRSPIQDVHTVDTLANLDPSPVIISPSKKIKGKRGRKPGSKLKRRLQQQDGDGVNTGINPREVLYNNPLLYEDPSAVGSSSSFTGRRKRKYHKKTPEERAMARAMKEAKMAARNAQAQALFQTTQALLSQQHAQGVDGSTGVVLLTGNTQTTAQLAAALAAMPLKRRRGRPTKEEAALRKMQMAALQAANSKELVAKAAAVVGQVSAVQNLVQPASSSSSASSLPSGSSRIANLLLNNSTNSNAWYYKELGAEMVADLIDHAFDHELGIIKDLKLNSSAEGEGVEEQTEEADKTNNRSVAPFLSEQHRLACFILFNEDYSSSYNSSSLQEFTNSLSNLRERAREISMAQAQRQGTLELAILDQRLCLEEEKFLLSKLRQQQQQPQIQQAIVQNIVAAQSRPMTPSGGNGSMMMSASVSSESVVSR